MYGSIFSSISNGFNSYMEGKAEKKSAADNRAFQREVLQNQIQWRRKDAEAAGVNVLAALGINPAQGQNVYSDFRGPDMSSMGQAIDSALNRIMSPERKELARLDVEEKRAKIKGQQLLNQATEKELNESNSNLVLSDDPRASAFNMVSSDAMKNSPQDATIMQPKQQTAQKIPGVEVGSNAENQVVDVLYGGKKISMSERMAEVNESSPIDLFDYTWKRLTSRIRNIDSYDADFLPQSSQNRRALMALRPTDNPKGWEYRFDPFWDTWYLVKKKHKYDTQYYYQGKPWIQNNGMVNRNHPKLPWAYKNLKKERR